MAKEFNAYDELQELKKTVLERAKERLEELADNEKVKVGNYDFNSNDIHEIIHEEVDSFVSCMDRQDCLSIIDEARNEDTIDKGLVDTSDIDRTLLTTAYACAEQWLFDNSDLIMDLQEYELTEEKRKDFIKRIKEEINE